MYPVAAAVAARANGLKLSQAELTRYSRHLLLPEVGLAGQLRLKAARVLVVGLGGLGAPASLYLAAAGVGTLGLVDDDVVDASNLQRQILYTETDVGAAKVATTAARLRALNSAITLNEHAHRLERRNVVELVAPYDLVLDGTDNFATRYLLNDTCVRLGKPYVYGSILRFAGQASVFYPPHGPCYRCLFPRPPAPGQVPSCAEGGVLGVLPGQIGSLQAAEAIKLLLGLGTSLLGRLLTFDALTMRTDEFRLPRDPGCPACGDEARLDELAADDAACGLSPVTPSESHMDISLGDFHQLRLSGAAYTLVDVRSAAEYSICHLQDSRLIPLPELAARCAELPKDGPLIVHCKGGPRSQQAVHILRQQGFTNARSLSGGILAWARAYEPALALY